MLVRWTASAQAELHRQIEYVAADSLAAAFRLRDIVLRYTELLAETPEMGRTGRRQHSRELVIAGTPYIAIYRIRKSAVEIFKFLHGAQKYP